MAAVSVRYYAKTDTHFIQIRGAQYGQLNTKIKHLTACLQHLHGEEHTQERARLTERRRHLIEKRRQAQHYIMIPASDVPQNIHVRPIYDLWGEIVTVEPERYAQLLDKLRGPNNMKDSPHE